MSDWWNADPVYSPEGFRSNPRGFKVKDVQAAVSGEMFNAPGLPIKYEAQPGQQYGVDATRNAQPFGNIVAHHTGGPTLQGALESARRGSPFDSSVKNGYHFYIDTDGTVVQGAPLDARTNHVQPPTSAQRTSRPDVSNSNSVGVSFVGDSSNPTPQQLRAAENLSRSLMEQYGIQPQNVVGHGEIQSNRQASEGMPLVNAIRNGPAVAQAPAPVQPQNQVSASLQSGGTANAAPAAAPASAAQPVAQNWWASDPVSDAHTKPDVGRGTAALEGYLSGASANFRDEVYGASEASGLPKILGGFRAPIGAARLGYEYLTGQPGEATKAYDAGVAEKRAVQDAAKEQYPGTYMAGNIGGALVLPGGAAMQAATVPARIARSAAVGAAYGGLSGAGEGDGAVDRVSRAIPGAAVGGVVGAAAVPALAGIEAAGRGVAALARPVTNRIRGALDAEGQAARTLTGGMARDVKGGGTELTAQEFAAAKAAGSPVANAELGGETTRAVARWAANVSPEARATIQKFADQRFEGQGERAITFLQNIAGTSGNTTVLKNSLQQLSRIENRPAYAKAYSHPNAQGMWDEGFEQISQAPVVQTAIRAASITGANRGTIEGLPRIRSPFTVDKQSGQLGLRVDEQGNRMLPNLEFWDHVKRNLDKIGTPEAQTLNSALKSHLDDLVPSYKDARAGAAKHFGAEDAMDAGQKFVSQNMALGDAAKALGKMSSVDRDLFKIGFVSKLIDDIGNTGDRVNVINKIGKSENARTKLNMVLGPNGYRQLDALMSVEQSADKLRTALGNSTTVRQMVELGLAGSIGGSGVYNSDPTQLGIAAAIAGKRYVDGRVARHIAEMITSNDPNILAKGIKAVSGNKNLLTAFREMDGRLSKVGAQQAPALQIPGVGRAEDQPGVPRPPGQ